MIEIMKSGFGKLSSFLLLGTLALILLGKLQIAVTRFVDPDEFAYLHWTYLIFHGSVPYRDFFMNFTPLFSWLASPLMLVPPSGNVIILMRLWQYVWFTFAALLVFRITAAVTKKESAGFLATIIFLIFPMILDKSIDFRPDTVMTALFLLSFDLLLETKNLTSRGLVLTGIFLGTSLAILPKIIYGLVGFSYLLLHKINKSNKFPEIFPVVFGTALPLVLLLFYFLVSGIFPLAWENIVHGSTLIKQGEGTFTVLRAMEPFSLIYGDGGVRNLSWIVNISLWVTAVAGIAVLLRKNFPGALAIFLILLGGFVSFAVFPTPYMQYFIPLTAIASIFSAAGLDGLFNTRFLPVLIRRLLFSGILLVISISFVQQYLVRITPFSDNQVDMSVVNNILKISKPGETVYDMVGSYVFRPDAYYICCNVYSQFADGLNLRLPTLRESLIAKQTKYLILDRSGKSLWLPKPEDLDFMNSHYLPSAYPKIYTLGQEFSCQNGKCTQVALNGGPLNAPLTGQFSVVVPEKYVLTTVPAGNEISVNGKGVSGNRLFLSPALYNFSVPAYVSGFIIQLDR